MSKRLNILLIVLTFLCLTAAVCSADQWEDVKKAGELRFGVAPDYYPFVYYEGKELDGLDIALMNEIGKRLGVTVKPIDMAFEGLIDSANIAQVDLIGGGLSITDERQEKVDFTNPYYQSGGVLLGRTADSITEESISSSKIGVLKGTSFEQWIASNLLMGGKISPANVYTFSSNADTVNALKNGEIDLVLIDEDVYRAAYKNDSSIKVLNNNVVNERYAYAAAKGSTLIAQVNSVMRDMFKDGTAQAIADKYFAMDFSDRIVPSITRPAQVVDTYSQPAQDIVAPREVTAPEILANNPANCQNGMVFVSDVSLPDGTTLLPNTSVTKTWNIKNTGTCTWNSTYSFSYVKGEVLGQTVTNITKLVGPGETYEVSIQFTTPANNGEYTSWYQMRTPSGTGFGQTIWYDIKVNGTTGSTDQKVSQGTPKILKWYPDFYSTDNGKCPKTYYEVTNAYQVDFYINNQHVDASKNLSGYTYLCPPKKPGTYVIAIVATGETTNSTAYNFTDSTNYPDPKLGVSADWPHWTFDPYPYTQLDVHTYYY